MSDECFKVRIRYIEEIEQPLREEIGDLRQRLGQEQVGQAPMCAVQRVTRVRSRTTCSYASAK